MIDRATELKIQQDITKELEQKGYNRYTIEYNQEYNYRKYKKLLTLNNSTIHH